MDLWIDVFKTGLHTDSAGNEREWTENDLAEIANKYNNQEETEKRIAPLQYGHKVEDSDRALGWIKELKVKGSVLQAKFTEMSKELISNIKEGAYKFVSIGLKNDLMLRHIAILGAAAPAIAGLKPLNEYFSDSLDYYTIEFAEGTNQETTKDTQNMDIEIVKKWIKENIGTETYQMLLKDLKLIKEDGSDMTETTETKTEVNFSETPEYKSMQEQITALNKKNADNEFELYYREFTESGNLVPAQKELLKAVLNGEGYNFTENEKEVKLNKFETMSKFIKSFPKGVEFGEFAKKNEVEVNENESELIKNLKELNK